MLLRSIANPRVAVPIAGGVLILVCWWGVSATHLARQIDRRQPTPMRFEEAVAASKDGELYVRVSDARLDCDKGLVGPFGQAFALLDHESRVAAMVTLPSCDKSKAPVFEGVFRHPPYLLYGSAVGLGWDVTPGHLAFLDSKASSFDPWLRVSLAVLMGLLIIASLFATSTASRALSDERVWQVRAIGFGVMAMMPWATYEQYDYVVFGFVPVPLVTSMAAAIGLGMVLLPRHAAIQRLTSRFMGDSPL